MKKTQQHDLFGKPVRKRRTRSEILIAKMDRENLSSRAERLRYVSRLFPENRGLMGNMESVYIFMEARASFVYGQYIATLLLCQAFIERRLQFQMDKKGYPGSSRGLKYILKYCEDHNLLPAIYLKKLQFLRNIRNPFAHFRSHDSPYSFPRRLMEMAEFSDVDPERVLFTDAKDALNAMLTSLNIQMR